MKISPWALGGDLEEPPGGVGYDATLRVQPVTTGAFRAIGGVVAVLAGYAILVPGIAYLIVGLAWLARGRPGSFAEFCSIALKYGYIDGLVATNLGIASLIVVTMAAVRWIHRRHPRWLCSVQPGFRWRYGLACVLIAFVGLNAVYWVVRIGQPVSWNPGPGTGWWLLAIVATSPLQAAGEEFCFRGYLLQAAGTIGRRPVFAVGASAFVFAIMHGTQNLPLFVDRLGFGLLAGFLVVATGGLEAAIAAHVVNNVSYFGYAAFSGGLAQARAIQASTWTTTAWDLLGYGVVGVAAWFVGRRMHVATRTPRSSSTGTAVTQGRRPV